MNLCAPTRLKTILSEISKVDQHFFRKNKMSINILSEKHEISIMFEEIKNDAGQI